MPEAVEEGKFEKFHQRPPDRVIAQNAHAMAIRDAYPSSQGHTADPRGGVRWIFPEKAVYWGEEPAP